MAKNRVNPGFGKRYVNSCSRVARFEQARLQRTLIREYKARRRRPCQSYFSALSASSAVKYLVFIRVNSWKFVVKTKPFLKKQTQFFAVFSPKTTIPPNSNPIQSQFKPNLNPIKPNQTQFLSSNTIRANPRNPRIKYTFLCKTNPNFLVFTPKTAIWRKNKPKTNPNKPKLQNRQNEPIPFILKEL